MQGGQRLRWSSRALACSGNSVPSMYAPRRSTHSFQCSMGLVKRACTVEVVWPPTIVADPRGKMHFESDGFVQSGSFGGFVEELAQLLTQGQAGPVEPAFHSRYGQIQRLGDVLVGQPVDVLEEEDGAVIVW